MIVAIAPTLAGRLVYDPPLPARRDQLTQHVERALRDQRQESIGYVDCDWSAEEWTRGCYGAHLPPGAWTRFGASLREPVGRIHWAGTETAERWMGYVDGAIESGIRAAAEVLERVPSSVRGAAAVPKAHGWSR